MSNRCREASAPSITTCVPAWPPRAFEAPGLGWSESSWDLACGLTVLEGLPADANVAEWIGAALVN